MKTNRFLYLTVFIVGISILGAEIAAARLLAPFFGASTIVWANTIGVVLVALSLGYWYGGKLGDRYPEVPKLCQVVVGGAVLLTLIPFVAQPFFEVAISALDEIEAGAFVGSLFAVLFLVAIPLAVLGTASPWALRLSVDEVENAGAVAGRLYAISTVGSLLGTMISALVLIPFVGTQRTFIVFGVMLALVGALGLPRRYLLAPAAHRRDARDPGRSDQVDRGRRGDLREGLGAPVHPGHRGSGRRPAARAQRGASGPLPLCAPDSVLTDDVWDGYLVLPFAGLDGPPERIAILGNAAGTTARSYGEYLPDTQIDGVEIDPELEEVGNKYFDMDSNENLTVHSEDARPWLRRSEGGYDAIFVDAYRQPYIPFYLATEEFFSLVRERLAPGGVVVVNAGHPEGNDDLEKVLGRTMSEAFPNVMRDPIEPTNTLLVASEGELSADSIREGTQNLPVEVANLGATEASRFGELLAGGEVYSDDRAPVEWLIDRSILGYAGDN